jgi:hypothetical protein
MTRKPRKLSLDRETLRHLSEEMLTNVAGATIRVIDPPTKKSICDACDLSDLRRC